jgi:serine protease Do
MRRFVLLLGALALAAGARAAMAPDEIYAKVSPSIWRVQTYDADGLPLAIGTGVVIAPDTLVTNCHVLAKAKRVTVKHEKVSVEARLELWDPQRDVCQIKAANLGAPAVELGQVSRLKVGQNVYALGTPKGLDLTMSAGLLSSIRRNDQDQVFLLQTSAAISGGSSGGGLFDDRGVLIGLTTIGSVTGDAQNLNFAVPVDWVKELPQRHAKLREATPSTAQAAAGTVPESLPATPPMPTVVKDGDAVSARHAPRRGDEFEYTVTDRFTGASRRVIYRVDRVEGDKVVFNNGDRTESVGGRLLAMGSTIGGDMDWIAPPDGWGAGELVPGASWRLRFMGRHPTQETDFDLLATVEEETTVHTEAGEFEVVHVRYTGWGHIVRASQQQVTLDIWYSPTLHRVVRFVSDVRKSGAGSAANTSSRELAELTGIRHP